MKFTDGYWCVRPHVQRAASEETYRIETRRHAQGGPRSALRALVPSTRILSVGHTMNLASFTITVSSPAMVPNAPAIGCLSTTLATYCAAPDGVCTTTRFLAEATEVTSPESTRDICSSALAPTPASPASWLGGSPTV